MQQVLCYIWNEANETDDAATFTTTIAIGRDSADKAFWKLITSPIRFPRFTATEGDWWYTHAKRTLDIYSDDGKTLEFLLSGVPDKFFILTCGPATATQGIGIRYPDLKVKYSIRAFGTCKPPRSKNPRRTR